MIGIGVDIGGTFVKFFVLNDKQEVLELKNLVAIIVKDQFRQETSEC